MDDAVFKEWDLAKMTASLKELHDMVFSEDDETPIGTIIAVGDGVVPGMDAGFWCLSMYGIRPQWERIGDLPD